MALAAFASGLLATCAGGPGAPAGPEARASEAVGGPMLVIVLDGLRSDVVEGIGGLPGLTPALDALIAEADWAGTGISSSSASPTAVASLLTGLAPHQHGAWGEGAALDAEVDVLAEALGRWGYRATAYLSSEWLRGAPGFLQGFERTQSFGGGRAAESELRRAEGRQLFFVEIGQPAPPYRLYASLEPRLDGLAPRVARRDLPERVGLGELARAARGRVPIAERKLAEWWGLYCINVARADQRIGQLLGALRDSGEWERSTVVVVSLRGEELGDYGRVGTVSGLRRRLIEVPLVIKLPSALAGKLPMPAPNAEPSTASLWASLVELGGGRRPPAALPSWFEAPPGEAWSERMLGGGGGLELSSLSGERQLVIDVDPVGGLAAARVWTWSQEGGESVAEDRERATELGREALARWRRLGLEAGKPPALERVPLGAGAAARHDSG